MQKGHQIGSLKSWYVMPALASVGFNRIHHIRLDTVSQRLD
ncbi:hypothetical protein [Yersinia enterocolitica]|nr:hypothetical protein [Yersinia enterocolitica]